MNAAGRDRLRPRPSYHLPISGTVAPDNFSPVSSDCSLSDMALPVGYGDLEWDTAIIGDT